MRSSRFAIAIAIAIAAPAAALGLSQGERGYLGERIIDLVSVLPPAPVPGDPRYDADRAIFRKTRALKGTDRFRLAAADVSERPVDMLDDFACSIGFDLEPAHAPHTVALLTKASADTANQNNRAKAYYQRQRPFLIDDGEICQARPLTSNLDYPSGHTTRGWTWALILSDLLPDRAEPILARGRAYGESRFICGAHNESAVEAGRLSATVSMQAVRQTSDYRHDFLRARAELVSLAKGSPRPDPDRCKREASLIQLRVR